MFISESQYIGFDIGKSNLRFVKLRKTRGGWDVSFLKEISSQDPAKLLDKYLKDCATISAVQTRETLFRTCDIPLKKTKDIFSALHFHIEPLLPYPLDKATIQAEIASQQDHGTSLMVFAVRKDHLQYHLELCKKNGCNPEITTTKAHALARLSTLLPLTDKPTLIVHESEEEITLVLVENGQMIASRAVDHKQDIELEIQKAFLSFASSYKSKTYENIYFFGKNSNTKLAIQTASGKEVLTPSSPFLSLTGDEMIHYGLAIGCALSHKTINFRQNEFAYPHPLRRLKKQLLTFFSLTAIFTLSFWGFSEMSLASKKRSLSEKFRSLLESEGRKIENHQTVDDYVFSLASLEKEVRARPSTFPLVPKVPKVKEVLGWLISLEETRSITMESFHYQMVARPDFSNRQEHYKIRIDLELSAADSNAARAFQETLKNSNLFVDPTEEIQWLPIKGKYKASFYLRDQTKYD